MWTIGTFVKCINVGPLKAVKKKSGPYCTISDNVS